MPLMGPVTVMSPITDLGYKPPLNPSFERENFPQQTTTTCNNHRKQVNTARTWRLGPATMWSRMVPHCTKCRQNVSHSSLILSHTLSYSPSPSLLFSLTLSLMAFTSLARFICYSSSACCRGDWILCSLHCWVE
jgi:hypothetical protein